MFDMHYDLLTKIYMCYKQNSLYKIEEWVKSYNFDNVKGLIANLCFMSIDEMKEEYDINYYNPDASVIEMFKISIEILKHYLPKDIFVLTSIEGCDFFESENDLEELKKLGLNAIVPVWNNKNKFGSGNRSSEGLTKLGEKLINKAIDLDIAIDLSHANEQTFWDIINIIKQKRNENIFPTIYASHSNVRALSDIERNLNDEQIKAIKEVDGIIGIMSNSNFVLKGSLQKRIDLREKNGYVEYIEILKHEYIKHIIYIHKLLGCIDNIAVSTDDMTFVEVDDDYKDTPIFNYETITKELRNILLNYYSKEDTEKILYGNAYNKLNLLVNDKKNIKHFA